MRRWREAILAAVACAVLSGCAEQPAALAPDRTIGLLGTGTPLLSCRKTCLEAWQEAQPKAAALAAGAKWRDLALLVTRIGYQDDLTLYYLGRAAEGLNYLLGARSYYRQSMKLSGTSISCTNLSRLCGGQSLPRDAALRVAAIDRALRPPIRRAAPGGKGAAPPVEPQASAPPAVAPREPPPPPVPAAAPQNLDEYIEPPPAR